MIGLECVGGGHLDGYRAPTSKRLFLSRCEWNKELFSLYTREYIEGRHVFLFTEHITLEEAQHMMRIAGYEPDDE